MSTARVVTFVATLLCAAPAFAASPTHTARSMPPIDHSGQVQKGKVSYYARYFNNRKMADGRRFNPNTNSAASKTLPIGTTARVTNLRNGKSATVTVEDRGPWVPGRVVDVTPKVANELEIHKQGIAPVVVAPITVPQPNGSVKLGAGATDISSQEVSKAAEQTAALVR